MRKEGELPEGWQSASMGDVAEVVGGGTPKASDPSNFAERGHPWITPADLSGFSDVYVRRGRRDLSDAGVRSCSAREVPAGTVLMSSRAPIGYLAIAEAPLSTNQGFKSFVCGPLVVPEYVYYWLAFSRDAIQEMGSGSTFAEVSGSRCKEIPIRFPCVDEQRRIAGMVRRTLRSVEASLQRLTGVAVTAGAFRRAVLAAACDGRLTRDDQREWRETSLGRVFSVQTGATPLRTRPEYFNGGAVPWIKTGQVQNGDIHGALEFITDRAVAETNAKVFPAGTILIAMYGEGRTRGQVARLRIPAATNQACAALVNRGLPEETLAFVFWYLRSRYDAMRQVSVGGNQPNLSLGVIKSWPVVLPPAAVQRKIVRRVESLFALADAIEKRVSAASARAEKLTQSILAKAFRGELVPTEAELSRRRQANGAPAAASPATTPKPLRRSR